MRKKAMLAIAIVSIFFITGWMIQDSLNNENPTEKPMTRLSYDYVGYAFIRTNATLEFHGILMEKEPTQGFSIDVKNIPIGLQRKTEIRDISCPNRLKSWRCRDITIMLVPTSPGSYDLSDVTIRITSNSWSVSSKLGRVKLEVTNDTFEGIKSIYYPYAGSYLSDNITPNDTFYYYTVFKNIGNGSIRITNVNANSPLIEILGFYYQEIPENAPPQDLDVPNIKKAKVIPQSGLEIKPGEAIALIVPLRIGTPAENAIISLKFKIKDCNNGKLWEVPGIPYYILGGG
ncbi:hypothetical protein E3E26_03470 [Thermococcus sp. LS1]|uniref:hypothetical protein n=1 Tax=Thermococcus sp. LS1 TaxID=1638259 RepID=UPI001439F011|nr:hypothetical protein [Thermococcus sp. LS1]NJD98856.1 hypothetical protein [Thermococcus sp. LS1]